MDNVKFLRASSAPVATSSESAIQIFVDVVHGWLAFNAYLSLTLGLLGVGWLAIVVGFVLSFCHMLGILELRDRGLDPTHIPTARKAIRTVAESVRAAHHVSY